MYKCTAPAFKHGIVLVPVYGTGPSDFTVLKFKVRESWPQLLAWYIVKILRKIKNFVH